MTQSSDPRGSNGANRSAPENVPGSAHGKPRSQQDTVLLSDVPDAESMRLAPSAADETRISSRGTGAGRSSNASIHTSNTGTLDLSSAALAALGQRYDILDTAGHGSMGNVYKARDRETGETVALKLLKPEIANDQQMIDRFKNELLFARKITHKNICRVHEFNRVGGIAYTSMEFVEGESLRSVLNRFGAMSLRKGIDLVQQMCSGLKEAHAQGIVHRDLKPENVMIDGRGNVKIMDFGIARSMESLTRMTGAMVGTPAYMAPEQVAGKPVDYRTDIYSLGLILYEVFTGTQAFTADNAVAVAMKQLRESPLPPHEVEPGIPAGIERAIMKALEKEPAKRFQSIAEMEKFFGSPSATGVALAAGSTTGGLATQDAFAMRSTGRASGTGSGRIPTLYSPPPKKRSVLGGIGKVALVILFAVLLVRGAGRVGQLAQLADQVPPPPRPTAPAVPDLAVLEDPSLADTAPQQATSAPAIKGPSVPDTSVATPAPPPQNTAPVSAVAPASSSSASPPNTPPAQQAPAPSAPIAPAVQPSAGSSVPLSPAQKPDGSSGGASAAPPDVQHRADAAFKENSPSNAVPPNAGNATASAQQPTGSVVPGNGPSYIWVARFDREDRAQDASRKIQGFGLNSFVMPRREAATGKQFFVVFTGPLQAARIPSTIDWLKSQGFDNVREVKGIGAGALNGRGANSQPASSGNDE
jgi:serine/threonine protein kinase